MRQLFVKKGYGLLPLESMDKDFEVGSAAVDGAVKHIIGKRWDQGVMGARKTTI